MNKSKIKLAFCTISILILLISPFTNSMAAENSMREKIDALKKKIEISYSKSGEIKPEEQNYCTVLIMLPTKYNPDDKGQRQPVPIGDIQKTAIEILEKFDQCSTIDPFPKVGLWKKAGIIDEVIEDVNVTIELDNVSMKKKEELVKYCRDILLERFKQEAIHMRFIPKKNLYDVLIVEKKS